MDLEAELKPIILNVLKTGDRLQTPSTIIQTIRSCWPQFFPSEIRSAIKSLVDDGVIIYSHRFSISHLELNFMRSLVVSPRLSLCHEIHPNGLPLQRDTVYLKAGYSFGSGDHPTTHLALKAVDFCVQKLEPTIRAIPTKALDIGTGTGVLAIASVFLGIGSALAIDIDPSALVEAAKNIELNNLQYRIDLKNGDLDTLAVGKFDLLMANLRPPTLRRLFPVMRRLTKKKGLWVISGFRPESIEGIEAYVQSVSGLLVWKETQNNWSALVIAF